ncbi:aminotransferase class V-fold PLP-dependent enzyme [Thalassotalea sp. Y01]|uniref:aminotransferase class V-fold PLP-dependent enzyme n=1 Tax=Thalassotalea sp. Y01 TaxID=2729613 RepID=UPI00145E8A0E|nr:aminotransferase class V-fold PLP-dependent enzyme [Thalassotalea sp. Y01]NMP17735.1 aminotransferase class V-fold PLP-dependent enzyme [Thalassotalea sp. Y01]
MLNLTDIQVTQNEIYLDNNATTPVLPQAAEAAIHTMNMCYGNPSSSHSTGIKAKYILESTRTLTRQVTGATDGEIIFTSGATEGIQTSIISALNAVKEKGIHSANSVLLYGATEHKAVPETLKHWNKMLGVGADVVAIPVDENGILDFEFIAEHASNALMICTMAANNETGVFQNLAALEKVIRDNNPDVLWMVDCVQALGKIDLELSKTTIDYAPFSGHKLYGPKGIGVLYVRHGAPYTPFIAGGGQESGLRSGTENLPGIAALNAIFNLLSDDNDDTFKSHQVLESYRAQLASTLKIAFPAIVYNHDFDYSLPTTLNFAVKGLSSKDIMDVFDAGKIRVSAGSACSSKVTGSFVLDAMGKPTWQSEGAIRMSFGPATTQQEIDNACAAILKAASAMRNSCLVISDTQEDIDSKFDGLQQWVYDSQCTWCYVDKQAKQVILIDPVAELSEKFETFIRCRDYEIRAILTTHDHSEKESCAGMLREIVRDNMASTAVDENGWPTEIAQTVELNDESLASCITLGDKVLVKVATPGHTNNSVTYLLGDAKAGKLAADDIDYVFAGDTIQIGGIGRSDFNNSNAENLYDSIQHLNALINKETLLCPAHDYKQLFTTTLALEQSNNTLLAEVCKNTVTKAAFVIAKAELDNTIGEDCEPNYCGNIRQNIEPSIDVHPDQLNDFITKHPNVMVIDVREPQEFEAFREEYLRQQKLVNVPLTQLTNFVHNHVKDKEQQAFICVCRSGNRSDAAAKTLKRMHFENVYHVPGGFALMN